MNILCTLYISGGKVGTLVSIPRTDLGTTITDLHGICATQQSVRFGAHDSIIILTDQGTGPRVDLQLIESKVVDEPLRVISSNDYVIVMDDTVLYKDKVYTSYGKIPAETHWKVIPRADTNDVVSYKSTGEIDDLFLREGYTRELKDAKYIVVPPDWDSLSHSCTPYDLLIKEESNGVYTSFSGRNLTIDKPASVDGRYIYISHLPVLEGTYTYPPFTYNMDTLVYKYDVLQSRLQHYGAMKVDSLCVSMLSLAERLSGAKNQYKACSLYEDIVSILDKARKIE